MAAMKYDEQLKDPRWKEKREEILSRDWYICQKCLSGKNLNVHHLYYTDGKMAWDYPNSALITLCGGCHKEAHGIDEKSTANPDVIVAAGERLRRDISLLRGLIHYMESKQE